MFKWIMCLITALLFYYAVQAFVNIDTSATRANALISNRGDVIERALGR